MNQEISPVPSRSIKKIRDALEKLGFTEGIAESPKRFWVDEGAVLLSGPEVDVYYAGKVVEILARRRDL